MAELVPAPAIATPEDADIMPIRKAGVVGLVKISLLQTASYVGMKLFGSLAGKAGKAVVVNPDASGFVFATLPEGGGGGGGTSFPPAPNDGNVYGMKDNDWYRIPSPGGGGGTSLAYAMVGPATAPAGAGDYVIGTSDPLSALMNPGDSLRICMSATGNGADVRGITATVGGVDIGGVVTGSGNENSYEIDTTVSRRTDGKFVIAQKRWWIGNNYQITFTQLGVVVVDIPNWATDPHVRFIITRGVGAGAGVTEFQQGTVERFTASLAGIGAGEAGGGAPVVVGGSPEAPADDTGVTPDAGSATNVRIVTDSGNVGGTGTTKIRIKTLAGDLTKALGWGEIVFLTADDGVIAEGTPSASSERLGTLTAAQAFDNLPATQWAAEFTDNDPWIQMEWVSPVSPAKIRLRPESGDYLSAPTEFEFEFWDGAAWVSGGSYTYAWPSDFPRNFALDLGDLAGEGGSLGWGEIAFLGKNGEFIPSASMAHDASSFLEGFPVDAAWDGAPDTGWRAGGSDSTPYIGIDFDSPITPAFIRLRPIAGLPASAITDFTFRALDEALGTWVDVISHTWDWAANGDTPKNFPFKLDPGFGGTFPAHRAWRVRFTAAGGSNPGRGLATIEFRAVSDGEDMATGGTAIGDGGAVANLFDGNGESEWDSIYFGTDPGTFSPPGSPGGGGPSWAGYDFGSAPVGIAEIFVRGHNTFPNRSFGAAVVEWTDTDPADPAVVWTVAWEITGQGGWDVDEAAKSRTFTRPV